MPELKPLEDHHFFTVTNDRGQFTGRVREFESLRTRPQRTALDARAEIITLTRDKLRQLEDDINPLKGPAPR